MRKTFFSLALGVVAMLTSCQKEADLGITPDGTNEVTFNVTVDNPTPQAVGTRAGETTLTRYIMEMYEGETVTGTPAERIEQPETSFTVGLKDGKKYTMLFWADYGTPDDNGEIGNDYNAGDLKAVKIVGQATKEAYTGKAAFTYDIAATTKDYLNVTLKHAVAKVNFIQAAGANFAGASNSLTLSFSNTYSYNAATEAATALGKAVNYTFTGIASTQKNLGTAYLFANTSAQTVIDFTAQLNTEDVINITNTPFQTNHVTNITGKYSKSSNETFNVTVSPDWDATEYDNTLYTIGDTYPKGATGSGIKGIVFEVSNGGINGKIVSTTESADNNISLKTNDELSSILSLPAIKNTDGRLNMNMYLTASSDLSEFPAYKYVYGLNSTTPTYTADSKDVWYVPSAEELTAIYTNVTTINTALSGIDGAIQFVLSGTWAYTWMLSSTFDEDNYGSSKFISIGFGDGATNYVGNPAGMKLKVRAIMAF